MSFLIIIFSKYLVQLYKQYSKQFFNVIPQGVRKSVLQSDIWASCSVACTSPNIISTSLKNFLTSRIDYTVLFFCNLNSSKNFTCPSGKSRTIFTSPGLLDTTFLACCTFIHSYLGTGPSIFMPIPLYG